MLAAERWPRDGVPDHPRGWIVVTARHRAIDRIRRERTHARKTELLARLTEPASEPEEEVEASSIPDERLSLVFMCCHPALALEAQVALTLRLVAGLSTDDIARAFLLSEPTIAQRLVRAKKKIRATAIPFRVPPDPLLPERLAAVLAVIYLVFNEGYSNPGPRAALCGEAIRLGRVLASLMDDEAEVHGLLALMLLHDVRRAARLDAAGEPIPLEDQDRAHWDLAALADGRAALLRAGALGAVGPYQLQAAIAAEHVRGASVRDTDWPRIAALYDALARLAPTPVVALNRAAAIAMAHGPGEGLARMEELAGELDGYHLFHAARADLLRRLERPVDAAEAYRRALALAVAPGERALLQRRLRELDG